MGGLYETQTQKDETKMQTTILQTTNNKADNYIRALVLNTQQVSNTKKTNLGIEKTTVRPNLFGKKNTLAKKPIYRKRYEFVCSEKKKTLLTFVCSSVPTPKR